MELLLWLLIGVCVVGGGERIFHHFVEKRNIKQLYDKTEEQFTALFNQTAFGVIALNRTGSFDRANMVFLTSLGYTEEDVIGKFVGNFLHEYDLEDFAEHLQYFKDHPDANAVREKRFRHKNGEYVWMMLSCAYIPSSEQIIGQTIDITDRKDAEETIYQLAYYDTLTALPNRLHFNQVSTDALDRARKGKYRFAIFLLDLDNFKAINDTYGHHVGDALLKEVAIKLDNVIGMRCESEEQCKCFCARLGGDEFVLVIEHIQDIKDAAMVADWLYTMFQSPIQVGPHDLKVSVTTGISIYPYDGTTVSSLLRSADLALYTAKDKGKNTYLFHETEMNERFEQLFEHNNVLKYMLDTNDFDLMYQPTVDISTGKVTGVEALLAGNKQKYPRLDIQSLIILAEENGMIVDLGIRILEKACRDYVLNISQHAGPKFGMAVNVSVRQLEDPQFVAKVATVIHDTGMPPDHLILEITETAMATRFYDVTKKLRKLSDIGVRFAIDDFGKGYASMSHLRQLHAHKLKIDKSLVDDVNNSKGKEIVRTIILMSHALKLTCVAEGVETDDVFRTLREMDCDEVQGYLISPSLMMADLKRYLALSLR